MNDAGKTIYQPIDHTGDLGMLVFGADLHELFAHAAWGLFDLMTDAECVEPRIRRDLTVEAMDLEDLMVRWLGELLLSPDRRRVLRQRLAGTGHFRHLICHAGGWLQPCGVDL